MLAFRFIAIFLFAFIFTNGKVQDLHQVKKAEETLKSKTKYYGFSKVLSGEDSDEDSGLKRKRKHRCVEVTVPHIERISFEQPYTYEVALLPAENKIYSSTLEEANGKRGPPQL